MNWTNPSQPKTAAQALCMSRLCRGAAVLTVVLTFAFPTTEAYGQSSILTRNSSIVVDMSVLDELGVPPTEAGQFLSRHPAPMQSTLNPATTESVSRLMGRLALGRFNHIASSPRQVSSPPKPIAAPEPPTPTQQISTQPVPSVATSSPATLQKEAPTQKVRSAVNGLTRQAGPTGIKQPSGIAITAYGGVLTANKWFDPFTHASVDFRDSWMIALAGSIEVGRVFKHMAIELEGQVVRHVIGQNHWEFNVPVVFRWEKFPWDNFVDTSFAYGIGPSYATKVPPKERDGNDDSHRFLIYWMGEIELGLPQSEKWSVVARLHHRSGGFGLVADEGASNIWGLGVKRRF